MHTHIWRLQDIDGTVMDEAKETANGRLTCEISEGGSGYIGKQQMEEEQKKNCGYGGPVHL